MIKHICGAAFAAIVLAGCATAPVAPALTPLEIQSMQTREYQDDKKIVFASVMSVFQDLGYTIGSADLETGFLTASSAASTQGPGLAEMMLLGAAQARQYTNQTRSTASVEQTPSGGARVRLNFVVGTQASSGYGQQTAQDKPILDPQIYQNAFEKIETAIFVRTGSTSMSASDAAADIISKAPSQQ